LNNTKNFSIGEIVSLVSDDFIPYVGATKNANLGAFSVTASSFIVGGGLASQFLKANGTLDSTVYVPASRTLTINGTTYDLSANRTWNLSTLDSLTTIGTGGAATYISNVLNIPIYQPQGNYITQLSGEATASGPGNATVTLSNLAVISKILTGLNITGGTVTDTDSILTAFGKVQNQINGLTGGVTYQGTWNAATNTPTLTSSVGTKGYYYVVNVAGSTNLNGITDWKLGDWAIFNGSTWEKVDNTDAVVSVNGYTGAVVLTFSDVGAPPATRTLTINGTEYDLTANRSWTVGDVRTDQTYSNPSWITSLGWNKITSTPTTLAGYGITDGASNTTTLTINGVTFDISANRTWNVGTVTSVGTSGPLTGGTITGSGTIGITQSGASSDGYLSSTDWNTFNNKQGPLVNPVTGTGTIYTLPMWSGATSLVDSPLSYGPDAFNFKYNSATGGTVNFTNIGLTSYTYAIQMNNFGSPRSTVHSYTDGIVVNSIGSTQVSRMFANGNFVLGTGFVDNGYKLEVGGNLYINTIANATTDTDRFIVSDGGVIKYRTGAELLSDIGAQGALTLTTTGSSGPATLISNVLNIPQYTDQFIGTVTSVGLSMPPAFTVSNSPITSAGTLTVVGAGTAAQYVRGDGALATLPTSGGGGGASVSYYLNGSVNQGTIGGVTYYEMNKTPIIGAGTDFTRNTNGYIASFLTDANDPSLLEIPAGNWNFETYFNASSGGGSPTFYIELYKYDGTTFTLIASNSGTPKLINDGTSIEAYFSALAVPQTTLAITDRLAVRIYVNTAGRTITLHTENGHLCQVITTFTTGLTALNGLTAQVQYLATGTSGTDFNILSTVATHTFNLPTASAINRGALSSSDWSIFNGKQNAITLTTTGTSGAATLVGATLNIPQYQSVLTNPITGTGTINYLAKFTGASAIGDSLLFDSGSGVGIGTASVNASALFQMDSTTKGFLPPRMTVAQRGAIASPADGLLVIQTDGVRGLYIYINATWRAVTMV
jgi:predicted heme/steroid binding protein